MVDWNKKFKSTYDYSRAWLADQKPYDKDWQPLVAKLYKLMGTDGFEVGEADSLSKLRRKVKQGERKLLFHKTITEDRGILEAVGGWSDNTSSTIDAQIRMRAAALKLLRHTYLLNRSGNRKTWIVSLPTSFTDWPPQELNSRGATQSAARQLLRDDNEIFSLEQRKDLASSTQHALNWCQKTGMVLANATKSGRKGTRAREVVQRWFADPAVTDTQLDGFIGTLSKGFKDIIARLNKGHFILTDWVPLRGASTAEELSFLNSEAFTFSNSAEGLDVVYIERSFFVNHPGNVLKGQKNWTRIIVHELTHLVCGTTDVNIGQARYAWYGIGPHAGFPGSAAIRNADSWAFFCADCAGVLTDNERNTALKII